MRTICTILAVALAGASLAACSCHPEVAPPDVDPPELTGDTSQDTATEPTGDTGPAPPCEQPEVEPNNGWDEAAVLPLEVQACGVFDTPADFDYWEVSLPEDAWLSVRVEAAERGSLADVAVTLTGQDTLQGAIRENDDDSSDVHLLFPAVADDYMLFVYDEQNKSGDRYDYQLLVSQSKSPVFLDAQGEAVDWLDEVEPNDSLAEAMALTDGDAVMGAATVPRDGDWYKVAVPPGKHTVIFDVEGYGYGSPGDFEVLLYNSELEPLPLGCHSCAFRRGPSGEADPYAELTSTGDEVVYAQIREEGERGGVALWYLLQVQVEGQ